MNYSARPNNSGGPGWHVVNHEGNEVCWVFEQPWGGPDKERAEAIARMLNAPADQMERQATFGQADGCENSNKGEE